MSGLGKGLIAACAALALTAPDALGAATRADYAAQVNAICLATDVERDAVYTKALKKAQRQKNKASLFGLFALREVARLERKSARLDAADLPAFAAVPAAPGDESLAALWLKNRTRLVDVRKKLVPVTTGLDKVFFSVAAKGKRPRFSRKQKRRVNALFSRFFVLSDKQVDLKAVDRSAGTELGVTACITEDEDEGFGSVSIVIGSAAARAGYLGR